MWSKKCDLKHVTTLLSVKLITYYLLLMVYKFWKGYIAKIGRQESKWVHNFKTSKVPAKFGLNCHIVLQVLVLKRKSLWPWKALGFWHIFVGCIPFCGTNSLDHMTSIKIL